MKKYPTDRPNDVRPFEKVMLKKTWKKVAKTNKQYNKTFNTYYGMPEHVIETNVGNDKVLIPIPLASNHYRFEVGSHVLSYPQCWFKEAK